MRRTSPNPPSSAGHISGTRGPAKLLGRVSRTQTFSAPTALDSGEGSGLTGALPDTSPVKRGSLISASDRIPSTIRILRARAGLSVSVRPTPTSLPTESRILSNPSDPSRAPGRSPFKPRPEGRLKIPRGGFDPVISRAGSSGAERFAELGEGSQSDRPTYFEPAFGTDLLWDQEPVFPMGEVSGAQFEHEIERPTSLAGR